MPKFISLTSAERIYKRKITPEYKVSLNVDYIREVNEKDEKCTIWYDLGRTIGSVCITTKESYEEVCAMLKSAE